MFELSKEDIQKYNEWYQNHECGNLDYGYSVEYCFLYTYKGNNCIIKCICGQTLDLEWDKNEIS